MVETFLDADKQGTKSQQYQSEGLSRARFIHVICIENRQRKN